jgi:hypothetical protein
MIKHKYLLQLPPCSCPAHQYPEFKEMLFADNNIFQFLQEAVNIENPDQTCLDTAIL